MFASHSRVVMLDDPDERLPELPDVSEAANSNNQQLASLAEQVRTVYCLCFRDVTGQRNYGDSPIPRWDGDSEGISGRRSTPVWPKIAETIVRCGADPVQFVRSQFYDGKRARPPYPNQMYSDEAVARWEAFRETAKRNLSQRLTSDLNQIQISVLPLTANLGWDYRRALDYALKSPTCGASPLIRYCVAVKEALPVASEFRERALLQYVFQLDDYDDLIANQIPPELRDDALAIRRRLLSGR